MRCAVVSSVLGGSASHDVVYSLCRRAGIDLRTTNGDLGKTPANSRSLGSFVYRICAGVEQFAVGLSLGDRWTLASIPPARFSLWLAPLAGTSIAHQ